MKVLLAIDGSAPSDAAVSEVCRRPWPQGTEVRIITVENPWKEELLRGNLPSMYDEINVRLRAEAWQRLNAAAAKVRSHAPVMTVTPVFREGQPKDKILDEAEEWGADLIVVGSHGYGTLKRFLLGSVSMAVATGAHCSVEIVRAGKNSRSQDTNPQ